MCADVFANGCAGLCDQYSHWHIHLDFMKNDIHILRSLKVIVNKLIIKSALFVKRVQTDTARVYESLSIDKDMEKSWEKLIFAFR